MKAADLPTEQVLGLIAACNDARCEGDSTWGWHGGRPGYGEGEHDPPTSHWAITQDIAKALGNPPEKVVLAKLDKLIRRGYTGGCACGCRGDFEITDKGRARLEAAELGTA